MSQTSLALGTTGDILDAASRFAELVVEQDDQTSVTVSSDIVEARALPGAALEGIIQIAVVPLPFLDLPEGDVLLQPFLAEDAAGIRRVISSEVGAYTQYRIELQGFRVLAFWQIGTSTLTTTTPIRSAAELEGRKVALFSNDPSTNTMLALGASPSFPVFAEVVSGLQAGAFDSVIAPHSRDNFAFGLYEQATFTVDRPFRSDIRAVLIPIQRWDELDVVSQTALVDAARVVASEWDERVQRDIDIFRETSSDAGITLIAWNQEDVFTIRTAAVSVASERIDQEIGEDLVLSAYEAAQAQPAPLAEGEPHQQGDFPIYFATDRQRSTRGGLGHQFSARRAVADLSFGEALVGLHSDRRLDDDLGDVTEIFSVTQIEDDDFVQGTLEEIADSGAPVVIYVHGYNNTFSNALRRGAVLNADHAPDAVVIVYSWASEGLTLAYAYDESSSESSATSFKDFMYFVTQKVPPERISVVAHSMGARVLLPFVESLQDQNLDPMGNQFANLVFAASDVSQDRFLNVEERPRVRPVQPLSAYAEEVTVYVSQHDRALKLSFFVHQDERLGRAKPNDMINDPDITAIDASDIDPRRIYHDVTFINRHSYIFDKPEGVQDLAETLARVPPPRAGQEWRRVGTRDYLGLKEF
ncbi:MAG: TRAP transporter substrate-binding protein DctP [Silicimonas sp.]